MSVSGEIVQVGEGRSFSTGLSVARILLPSGAADFDLTENVVAVNPIGVGLHRHHRYDEAFYLIEGEMEFVVGDRAERCGPGTFVFVPRGVAHRFANHGPSSARMLVLGSSGVQALVEEVGPLANATPFDPEAFANAFARHDSELVSEA